DHAILIDPHTARHIHDAEQLVKHMRLVYQSRMAALGLVDPRASRVASPSVKRDADDLQPLWIELLAQLAPTCPVRSASAPRCRGDHHDLPAVQRAEREVLSVPVGKDDFGELGAG